MHVMTNRVVTVHTASNEHKHNVRQRMTAVTFRLDARARDAHKFLDCLRLTLWDRAFTFLKVFRKTACFSYAIMKTF